MEVDFDADGLGSIDDGKELFVVKEVVFSGEIEIVNGNPVSVIAEVVLCLGEAEVGTDGTLVSVIAEIIVTSTVVLTRTEEIPGSVLSDVTGDVVALDTGETLECLVNDVLSVRAEPKGSRQSTLKDLIVPFFVQVAKSARRAPSLQNSSL